MSYWLGWPGVTTETRPPRVGVAFATSTSKEASCTPVSTTSSSHCTSPSTSCWSPAGDPATHLVGWPTASSSVWPWPRSCWVTVPNAAGCGRSPTGWGTCSPMCAARPPTTGGCAGRHPWSPPSCTRWRSPARPGVTNGGCWTPPRSPAAPPARPCDAASWPAGPAMAMTPAIRAGTGAQAVSAGLPGRPAGGLVPGQPHPGRA
jgi:hypothetical protein